MKNHQIASSSPASNISIKKVPCVKNEKPQKVVNVERVSDRLEQTKDIINTSSTVPQLPITYSNIQVKPALDEKKYPQFKRR